MGRNWHEGGAVGPEDGWVDGGHSSGSGWVGPEMGGGIGSGTSFGLFPASHRHSFVHLLFFCNLPQAHQLGNQENVWRSTHVPGQLVSQCNAILVYVATGFAGIPKISKIKHFLSKCLSTGNINDIVHPIVHPCFFFKMSTFDKGLSVLVWALVIEN